MFKQVKEDISAVFARDPAARNSFEILINYPGIHALIFYRCSSWLWRKQLKFMARTLSQFARWVTGIEIHPGAKIGKRLFIDHGMGVVIGETAEIGDDVTIYHGVTLGGTTWNKGKRHPTLEDGVVVGAGAKILGPFTVSKNAKIGSNAVVTKAVDEGATVTGVPGRATQAASDEGEKHRKQVADKLGFDAYGASDMPDPIALSINAMLDHVHRQDERINTMCKALKALDENFKLEGKLVLDDEGIELDCCSGASEEKAEEMAVEKVK